jgi:predicted phage terminase large subunit-like protein
MLSGHNLIKINPTGSKEVRAEPVASQVNAGNVKMLKCEWNRTALNEIRTFPIGSHDDIVDCLADAFNNLTAARKFAAL